MYLASIGMQPVVMTSIEWKKNKPQIVEIQSAKVCRSCLKFIFSKKATKNDKIFTIIVTLKLCFKTKMTKLGVGHFTSISGHFFAKYSNSFHKTELLMVILKGLTCQTLNWIKSYDTNHKFVCFLLFSIL